MAYGKYTEEYNGTFGMKKEPTYLYIADPTQALASINVKTTEGYATYYNDNLGVTIPEGIDAKCGVITDVNNGALTIDYRYAAGTDEIPAGNAVLVKAGNAHANSLDSVEAYQASRSREYAEGTGYEG